jgi:hypothetical protein
MATVKERLSRVTRRPVIWVSLGKDSVIALPNYTWNTSAERSAWLEHAINETHEQKLAVHAFDASVGFESMLEMWVKDMCSYAPEPPVLLVDGIDEVDAKYWPEIEEAVLSRFLDIAPQAHLLIAHRYEYAFQSYALKRQQTTLHITVFATLEARAQLTHLMEQNKSSNLKVNIDDLLASSIVKPYKWNHPLANTLLFQQASHHWPLQVADVQSCLESLLNDSDPFVLKILAELATISPWTHDTAYSNQNLRDCVKASLTGAEMRQTLLEHLQTHLDKLFKQGVAQYVPGTQRYQVVDGVRELLLAWRVASSQM